MTTRKIKDANYWFRITTSRSARGNRQRRRRSCRCDWCFGKPRTVDKINRRELLEIRQEFEGPRQ